MKYLLFLINICFLNQPMFSQAVPEHNGSLVIAGGNARISPEIFESFIELAGGPQARLVVVPTANGTRDFGPAYEGRVLKIFHDLGATNVELVHTDDRQLADSYDFALKILNANGVWFLGGRQWRLADAYLDTATEKAFWEVLNRGGVIGGSSAGATIQGSYLVRGDTKTNTIMMGDHEEGFAFLPNSAIDQHLLRRNRQFDLVEVIEAKPELLGIGLDEGTAIVVRGSSFEVIGASYVAIYDSHVMTPETPFYLLAPGDRFDLEKRTPLRERREYEAMELPDE